MSFKAQKWTMQAGIRRCKTNSGKLVLAALAFHAHPDGRDAYPSAETISNYLGISDRQVRRGLKELEELGLIKRGDQGKSKRTSRGTKPIVYDLAFWIEGEKSEGEAENQFPEEPLSPEEEEAIFYSNLGT